MSLRRSSISLMLLLAATVLVGCNLPVNPAPTQIIFPTPNMTMTAIFNPPVIVAPTNTPPVVETSTQLPTVTAPPTQSPTSALATATSAPVLPTPAATATAVPAGRPSWTATFLSTAPNIDGTWDEWKTTQFAMKNVVWGAKNWTGSADLEGAFRIGWDNTNLYIAAKITDDKFVQNATGKDIYKGDSLELLIDANLNGDFSTDSLSADDYQVGITPGRGQIGKNMEAYRWFPASKEGSLTNIKIGAVAMSDGYRIEAAIPWSDLGVTPSDGLKLGFALSANDNDNASSNVQESMVSAVSGRILADPTTWGVLVLKK